MADAEATVPRAADTGTGTGAPGAGDSPFPYTFGIAEALYARKIHPRVMLGPADVKRLKLQIRREPGRTLFGALRARMRPLAQRVLESGDLRTLIGTWNHTWRDPGTAVVQGLFDLALTGVLADDRELLEAVRRVLLVLPQAEPMFGLASRPGYNLPHSLGWAYDLLWHELSPIERRSFADWALTACIRGPLGKGAHRYYRCAGGNITLHGMDIVLGTILALRGDEGMPDLDAELRECLRRLEATLHVVINPDGYPEEDVGYGTSVAGHMAVIVEAVRRAGLYDAYRQCPRVLKFGRAMLHLVQPWGGYLSNTGDHGDDFSTRDLVLPRLATETNDPALLWLLGTLTYPTGGHNDHAANLKAGREVRLSEALPNVPVSALSLLALDDLTRQAPARPSAEALPTAFRDRGRGLVTFRTGWDEDATFVLFDGSQRSPAAQGHAHDSCGHFSLSALGEYFAIDTGRYSIEQNGHNVVLIDGQSGRSTDGQWRMSYYHGLLTDYQPGGFVDTAAVDSSHQHIAYWARRRLGLVKGACPYVWTVDDINKANDWAEFWWQLQTSPENEITLEGERAVIRGWRQGNLLDVHFALPFPHEYPRPHTLELAQGFAAPSSHKYMDAAQMAREAVRPSDMLHHAVWRRPNLLAKVRGLNGRFMALMLPRRKDQPPAAVERLPAVDNSFALRITFGAVEDILIFAFEHNLLEAADVRGRGQWCVVRRARASGTLLDFALGDGTELTAGGAPVVA